MQYALTVIIYSMIITRYHPMGAYMYLHPIVGESWLECIERYAYNNNLIIPDVYCKSVAPR